jgi:hypothetical protein
MHDTTAGPVAPGRDARTERGAALFIVIVSLVAAAGLSSALLVVGMSRIQAANERTLREMALNCAEAGLDRGIAEANLPANRASTTWPVAGLTINSSPTNRLLDAGLTQIGSFTVTFDRGDTDKIDNDGDWLIDADDATDEKQFVTITSIGRFGGGANPQVARVQAQVRKETITPVIQSAIFIDDPTPDITLGSSNSYKLSGEDHDMTTRDVVPGPSLPALATTGVFNGPDTLDIKDKIVSGQINPVPPPANTLPDNVNVSDLISAFEPLVPPKQDITVTAVNPDGPFGIRPGEPGGPDWQLTMHHGYTKITGNAEGAGVWIVDGDLDIGGTLKFVGIIIVRGKVTFSGGGSGTQVTGAIITSDAPVIDFTVTGTTDIFYSSGAVAGAANAAARYVAKAWRQMPNP